MKYTNPLSPLLIALVVLLTPIARLQAQPGPGVVRTVPAIYSLDVSRYGAVGDGTTDATLAIQATLDAVNAAGGGEVTITRPGTYIVSKYLTAAGTTPTAPNSTYNSCLIIYSNTSMRIANGVTIKKAASSNCYTICNSSQTISGAAAGNSGITIDGGIWDFNDSASSSVVNNTARSARWLGHGMFFVGVDRLTVRNCRFLRSYKFSLCVANANDTNISNLTILNAIAGGDGIHFEGPASRTIIENISGKTGDNLIGFTTSEGGYFGYAGTYTDQTGGTTNSAPGTTLTKTGAFTNAFAGQYVSIRTGSGATAGDYLISSVTNANSVVLATSPGASATGIAFVVNGWSSNDAGFGAFDDVAIRGIQNSGGYEPIRFAGYHGINNVLIRDVSGVITNGALINFTDDINNGIYSGPMTGIVIDGVDGAAQSTTVAIYLQAAGLKDAIVRNVRMRFSVSGTFTGGTTNGSPGTTLTCTGAFASAYAGQYVTITAGTGATLGDYLISSVTNANTAVLSTSPGNSASAIVFTLTNDTDGVRVETTAAMDSLVIENLKTSNDATLKTALINILGTVNWLNVSNCYARTGNLGKLFQIGGSGVVTSGTIRNCTLSSTMSTGTGVRWGNTTTASHLNVSGCTFYATSNGYATYAIDAAGKGSLLISDTLFSAAQIPFFIRCGGSAGSPNFRIAGGAGLRFVTTTNQLIVNGASTDYYTVNHQDLQMAGDKTNATTPTTGDTFYNTSSAGSGGSPSTNWSTLTNKVVYYNGSAWVAARP